MGVLTEALEKEILRQESRGVGNRNLVSVLGDMIGEKPPDSAVDVLTYVQAPWGVYEKPWPAQRFILKLVYGIPLDDTVKDIYTWDRFKENQTGLYTEVEFLQMLNSEGRCNITLEQHQNRQGRAYSYTILRLGRRSGKTTLSQWITAYEAYRLLRIDDPQKHFNFRKAQPIGMTLVATNKEQAEQLLSPARDTISSSPYLKRFVDKDSRQRMTLYTQANLDRGQSSDSGVFLAAAACSARAIRGPGNMIALLEEYGLFMAELRAAGSNRSDREIFKAIAPSLADFTDPETGEPAGQVFVVSTPVSRESHMYELEDKIWSGELTNGLVVWMPSYWISENIVSSFFKNAHAVDPIAYRQEYEAEYLDQEIAAFTKADITACCQNSAHKIGVLEPGEIAYMGVDLGLRNDGTSITVVSSNETGECRVVHQELWRIGLGEYADVDELDIREIAQRVDYLFDYFGCQSGICDQYNDAGLKSHLKGSARIKLEAVHVTRAFNDIVARHAVAMVSQKRVIFYADERDWLDRDSLVSELSRMQRKIFSGDPPRISISAPEIEGQHDDQYSSFSRALWAARVEQESKPFVKVNPRHSAQARRVQERAQVLRARLRQSTARNVRKNPFSNRLGR